VAGARRVARLRTTEKHRNVHGHEGNCAAPDPALPRLGSALLGRPPGTPARPNRAVPRIDGVIRPQVRSRFSLRAGPALGELVTRAAPASRSVGRCLQAPAHRVHPKTRPGRD